MQTATFETESKSRALSICVHHYTLRAPCPKGQGTLLELLQGEIFGRAAVDVDWELFCNSWSVGFFRERLSALDYLRLRR